jgi:hypothetical protein
VTTGLGEVFKRANLRIAEAHHDETSFTEGTGKQHPLT